MEVIGRVESGTETKSDAGSQSREAVSSPAPFRHTGEGQYPVNIRHAGGYQRPVLTSRHSGECQNPVIKNFPRIFLRLVSPLWRVTSCCSPHKK